MGGALSTVRQHHAEAEQTEPLRLGNIAVFPEQYRATLDGRVVPLTYREFGLLVLLATRVDRVVTYAEVAEALWGRREAELRRRISVLVCRLRQKLSGTAPYRVETVRRVGYRLAAPLPRADGEAKFDRT